MYRSRGVLGWRLVIWSLASVVSASCANDSTDVSAPVTSSMVTGNPLVQSDNQPTLDDELMQIGARIPGFGGLAVEGGSVVLLLVPQSSDVGAAAEVLRDELSASKTILALGRGLPIKVRAATFEFAKLQSWRRAYESQVSKGTVLVDVSEAENLIRIGVTDDASRVRARAVLADQGVPSNAFSVEVIANPAPYSDTLAGYVRPTTGGLRISRQTGTGTANCTLGVNVLKLAQRRFVTSSHCGQRMLGPDVSGSASWYYQPFIGFGDSISTSEALDPLPFSGGSCPSGRVCRWGDVTLMSYADPNDWEGAHIAGPISSTQPYTFESRWLIQQTGSYPTNPAAVFGPLCKTGATTGGTCGAWQYTCTTYYPDSATYQQAGTTIPGNLTFLCQDTATNLQASSGDSGAPLFFPGFGFGPVYFMGIFHASNGVTYWFTPWPSINKDLGNLNYEIW
jgi:hypothetical protein